MAQLAVEPAVPEFIWTETSDHRTQSLRAPQVRLWGRDQTFWTEPEVTVEINQNCSGDSDSVWVQFEWSESDDELTSRLNWSEISQRHKRLDFYVYNEIRVKIFPFFTFMSLCCWLLDSVVNWSCSWQRAVRRLAVSMLTPADDSDRTPTLMFLHTLWPFSDCLKLKFWPYFTDCSFNEYVWRYCHFFFNQNQRKHSNQQRTFLLKTHLLLKTHQSTKCGLIHLWK